MSDIRIEKLAELLVNYSVAVKHGDRVVISGENVVAPLVNACYRKVLQAGGHPLVLPRSITNMEALYAYGSQEQIEYVHDVSRLVMNEYDARIVILGSENSKAFSLVPPEKIIWHEKANAELMNTMMRRTAKGEFKWVLAPFPTPSMAQDAEMSLREYEDFVYKACMPDMSDPVTYWRRVSAEQERIIRWLEGKHRVRVLGKETDLSLSIEDRKFISCAGERNLPDGEIFTGPVESSANGTVCFSYPAIESGHEVSGVRLTFENGKVVEATADKNEEFLRKTLDTDSGARYLGEFAIGTNEGITQFTREILFDEKINGSFHLALGSGYPETGSVNESAIHWDMVCDLRDGGEIWIDDELLYSCGRFVV